MPCRPSTPLSARGGTDVTARFLLASAEHAVWLSRTTGGYRLHADGAGAPEVALVGDGTARSLVLDGRAEPVQVVVSGEDLHVHLRGRTYHMRYLDPVTRHAGAAAGGAGALEARAPMPGMVVALPVQIGDAVQAGDALVVIESMKLETTIRATGPARVAAIHIAEGASFDRDQVLVTLAGEP
jgi:acetyl/propionyl-CoA carboxylase alpha subunit